MPPANSVSHTQELRSNVTERKPRILVVIACYGTKNLGFLRQIIQGYRKMDFEVDITVVSEAPKPLDDDVKVVVGLPAKNPWTLPFAHKQVFAENVDRYDLFIYSEDDIEVTEDQIRGFLRVTPYLEPSEIAGYVRYETDTAGAQILTDIHGAFHWEAGSTRRRGPYTIARLTNDHAGFCILTREQLRRAIASGGFLCGPYQGRYGLPETAATDAYTRCGFRKVVCISHFGDFLIRHMSNLYAGRHGLPLSACREQIQTLLEIGNGARSASVLCGVEPKILQCNWSKSFFERLRPEVLKMVPAEAATVLSVGAGCGETEGRLRERGLAVTVLPLDSVVGAALSKRGFQVVNGALAECARELRGRKFDCVLISHLLHLCPDPWVVLRDYAQMIGNGGVLLIAGYNFEFLPDLLKRFFGAGDYRKLRSFEESGLRPHGIGAMKKQLRSLGFRRISVAWFDDACPERKIPVSKWSGRFLARSWAIQARLEHACQQMSAPE